jgi:hypothetical protein
MAGERAVVRSTLVYRPDLEKIRLQRERHQHDRVR